MCSIAARPVLHLVQKIRDESHRFAVTYHRKRREIRDRESNMLAIPGVGPQTRNRLVAHFGSLRGVRRGQPAGACLSGRSPPGDSHLWSLSPGRDCPAPSKSGFVSVAAGFSGYVSVDQQTGWSRVVCCYPTRSE